MRDKDVAILTIVGGLLFVIVIWAILFTIMSIDLGEQVPFENKIESCNTNENNKTME